MSEQVKSSGTRVNPVSSVLHQALTQIQKGPMGLPRPSQPRPSDLPLKKLEEAILSAQNLLKNRKMVSSLPDNGQKIRDHLAALEIESVNRVESAIAVKDESAGASKIGEEIGEIIQPENNHSSLPLHPDVVVSTAESLPNLKKLTLDENSEIPGTEPKLDAESDATKKAENASKVGSLRPKASKMKDASSLGALMKSDWGKKKASCIQVISTEQAAQILIHRHHNRQKYMMEVSLGKLAETRLSHNKPTHSSEAISFLRYRQASEEEDEYGSQEEEEQNSDDNQ